MFTIKFTKSICLAVLLMTVSNVFSREFKLFSNFEAPSVQTSSDQKPAENLFILHESVPTNSDYVTIIEFELGEEADVELTVSNSNGELIETLIKEVMDPGDYKIHFKSGELIVSGGLTYKLEVKGISGVKNVFAVK